MDPVQKPNVVKVSVDPTVCEEVPLAVILITPLAPAKRPVPPVMVSTVVAVTAVPERVPVPDDVKNSSLPFAVRSVPVPVALKAVALVYAKVELELPKNRPMPRK
jgi:hypothetical protein